MNSETPTGGGTATTATSVWCGSSLCQQRDGAGSPSAGFYDEGEFASGSPIFYGTDQLGSVRRAFASTTSAPNYAFDAYGAPLQATAPLTQFGYARLINHSPSGLALATYRAYDPQIGRWLNRDPIGETGGTNLYLYVDGRPLSETDPSGQFGILAAILGFVGNVALQTAENYHRNGGDWGAAFNCVNLTAAGVAAAANFVLPSLGNVAKSGWAAWKGGSYMPFGANAILYGLVGVPYKAQADAFLPPVTIGDLKGTDCKCPRDNFGSGIY